MAEQDEAGSGVRYSVIPGGKITNQQARKLMNKLCLKPGRDALFPNATPQTWRIL